MSFDLRAALSDLDLDEIEDLTISGAMLPDPHAVSLRDIHACDPGPVEVEWSRLVSDPCPTCGAFRLDIGYYIHCGECDVCARASYDA